MYSFKISKITIILAQNIGKGGNLLKLYRLRVYFILSILLGFFILLLVIILLKVAITVTRYTVKNIKVIGRLTIVASINHPFLLIEDSAKIFFSSFINFNFTIGDIILISANVINKIIVSFSLAIILINIRGNTFCHVINIIKEISFSNIFLNNFTYHILIGHLPIFVRILNVIRISMIFFSIWEVDKIRMREDPIIWTMKYFIGFKLFILFVYCSLVIKKHIVTVLTSIITHAAIQILTDAPRIEDILRMARIL